MHNYALDSDKGYGMTDRIFSIAELNDNIQ